VTLDASGSRDPDGTIRQYQWDLGNGRTATGRQTQVTYGQAGDFTITLTVMDDEGATARTQRSVTVTEPAPVTAPCEDCFERQGSLSAGQTALLPDGNVFFLSAGESQSAWLQGPEGASFSVFLLFWDGSQWRLISQRQSRGEVVGFRHRMVRGWHAYLVRADQGSGDFRFWLKRQ